MTALSYNFAVVGDASPYTPAGLTVIQDTLKILGGALRVVYSADGQALAITSNPATTGLLDVTFNVLQSSATGGGDSSGALFCNSSGNGYAVDVRGTTVIIKGVAAKVISPTSLANVAVIYASNAQFRATYNLDTNEINVYQGASLILTLGSLTPQTGMAAGLQIIWENTGAAGIISATLDGFGATTSIDTLTTAGSPGLVVGQPFAMTTTGLGAITSVTITTTATPTATTTATSLSLPSGDGTGSARNWADIVNYAFPGTVNVVASDGSLSANGNYTLSLPASYVSVTFASLETTNATYLAPALAAISRPIVNGEFGYYINTNVTILPNGNMSCVGATTFVIWIQKASGEMQRYDVSVSDTGQVVVVASPYSGFNSLPTTRVVLQ